VHDAIVASDLKDAPYDSWKHAMPHESMLFSVLGRYLRENLQVG
jgi:hypothetical protein